MTISKEAKVGILALVSFAMLYLGFNFLKGSDFFSSSYNYVVNYDNVDGLQVSNPVIFNGLNIGRVKSIELLQDQNNKLRVTLAVKKAYHIAQGSIATLADGGLLGGKVIILKMGQSTQWLADGESLTPATEVGLTSMLKEKAVPVLSHADSLLITLNTTIKQFDQTGIALKSLLANSNNMVGTLNGTVADSRSALTATLSNFKQLSAQLVETEKELKPLLGKFGSVADSLKSIKINETLADTRRTIESLNKILVGLQAGEGTMGKVLKDEQLYNKLNESTNNLNKLLLDLRLHPKRYFSILRRKETPYKEPTPEEIEATKQTEKKQ